MASYNFEGNTILVTGAGAGIGKAICEKLTSFKAKVIALSLLQNELDELEKELPGIRTIQVDLQDWKSTRRALENVGIVHGLVNNAGYWRSILFSQATEEQFDIHFAVNVKAALNVSQVIAKSMIDNNIAGTIVNVSSIAGYGTSKNSIYSMSKAALMSTSKVMALELGQYGIRVNCVNPTVVDTKMAIPIIGNPVLMEVLRAKTPLGRIAKASEVADAVVFLLSDAASMVDGVCLPVDGGRVLN